MINRLKNLWKWSAVDPIGLDRTGGKRNVKELKFIDEFKNQMATIVEEELPNILEQEQNDTTS